MDILSETNYAIVPFQPNCYVDISDYMEDKIRIAMNYRSEFHDAPFPRSADGIRAQAAYRGSACYSHYAEAFQIVKEVLI